MSPNPKRHDATPEQEQPHREEIHMSVGMILYSLTFVVQPLEVSPNDSKSWETLSSVLLVLAGALTGLLASNGLKDKDKDNDI